MWSKCQTDIEVSKIGILNYTTQVKVEKTISEIEKILADHGANKILKEYEDGDIVAISFMIKTEKGISQKKEDVC